MNFWGIMKTMTRKARGGKGTNQYQVKGFSSAKGSQPGSAQNASLSKAANAGLDQASGNSERTSSYEPGVDKEGKWESYDIGRPMDCLLYTSPSPRD